MENQRLGAMGKNLGPSRGSLGVFPRRRRTIFVL